MPEGVPHFAFGEAARPCRHFPSDLYLPFLQPAAPYTEPPPREKSGGRNRRGAGSVLGGIEGYFCGEKGACMYEPGTDLLQNRPRGEPDPQETGQQLSFGGNATWRQRDSRIKSDPNPVPHKKPENVRPRGFRQRSRHPGRTVTAGGCFWDSQRRCAEYPSAPRRELGIREGAWRAAGL